MIPAIVVKRLLSQLSFERLVCLEDKIRNPVILIPCGHTMWYVCFETHGSPTRGRVSCPCCRAKAKRMIDWPLFACYYCPERLDWVQWGGANNGSGRAIAFWCCLMGWKRRWRWKGGIWKVRMKRRVTPSIASACPMILRPRCTAVVNAACSCSNSTV
jgi:hypothetical protein